jgi:hypothetical protein
MMINDSLGIGRGHFADSIAKIRPQSSNLAGLAEKEPKKDEEEQKPSLFRTNTENRVVSEVMPHIDVKIGEPIGEGTQRAGFVVIVTRCIWHRVSCTKQEDGNFHCG